MAYQDRYFKFSGWHWHKKAAEAARWRDVFFELREVCDAAISAPARQCDVGTALEQSERFMDFCRPGNRPPNCEECKIYPNRMNKFWCQIEWAQTPYTAQEGGAE